MLLVNWWVLVYENNALGRDRGKKQWQACRCVNRPQIVLDKAEPVLCPGALSPVNIQDPVFVNCEIRRRERDISNRYVQSAYDNTVNRVSRRTWNTTRVIVRAGRAKELSDQIKDRGSHTRSCSETRTRSSRTWSILFGDMQHRDHRCLMHNCSRSRIPVKGG